MHLNLLKTFTVFCTSRNIYEASLELGISQPAVSQQLKSLERYFGKKLFSLKGKKKIINPFGRAILESLAPLLNEIEQNLECIQSKFDTFENLKIRIAGRQEILNKVSDRIIFPGRVEFLPLSNMDSVQALLDGDVQYIVSYVLPDHNDIFFKKIFSSNYHFLIHEDLLENNNKTIESFRSSKFIYGQDLLAYSRDLPHISEWCNIHEINKRHLDPKVTISNWAKIVEMVEQRKGYTLCPSYFKPLSKQTLIFPVSTKLLKPFTLYLLYKKDTKELFPSEKVFNFN